MITSLSFAYLQYSSTTAVAATQPAAGAPAPAPLPVTRDNCRDPCDTPRRSPLFRALKDALMEMAQSTKPAPGTLASAASAADAAATNPIPAATPEGADTSRDLEEALMAFARTLMQAMRDEFGGRRERAHEDDVGRGHRHHHHGHGRWGDPAQRVEALAQQVGPPALAPAATATPPVVTNASPVADDVTTEPVQAPSAADTAEGPTAAASPSGTSSMVIVVASMQVSPADAAPVPASPIAGVHQRLLDAFAALQKAMGKTAANSGDALKSELGDFLRALADRLRGADAATAEAATQPGALLSIAA